MTWFKMEDWQKMSLLLSKGDRPELVKKEVELVAIDFSFLIRRYPLVLSVGMLILSIKVIKRRKNTAKTMQLSGFMLIQI